MNKNFCTSYELTISYESYRKLLNLAEDYGFKESVPIRKNVFVPVAVFEGLVEEKDFMAGDTYNLTNLQVYTVEENKKKILTIYGECEEALSLSEKVVKGVDDHQALLTKPILAVVVSDDYDEDNLTSMTRDLVTYLDGHLLLGEFTTRYDTYTNLANIMNANSK